MTTLEQRAHAMLDAASVVERAADEVAALAREHDATELLGVARVLGGTARTVDRIRERIVAALQLRPIKPVGGDRPSWDEIATTLGERESTTYGRHQRALRTGLDASPNQLSETQSAIAALTGSAPAHVLDAELPVEQLITAAQASWMRRQYNSRDGAAVLGALAQRIGWDEVAARTGIPVDVAQAWGTPPPGALPDASPSVQGSDH